MMERGEKYQCSNEECGCEISVTKASQLDQDEQSESPRCCCGEEMELMEAGARGSAAEGKGNAGRESEGGRGPSRSNRPLSR